MVRIILCCASGMSTSLLIEKMKRAAKELNIEAEIWPVGATEIKDNAEEVDCILLGPQVRYAQKKIKAEVPHIPVACIGMREYGMMDGKAVLLQALALIEGK